MSHTTTVNKNIDKEVSKFLARLGKVVENLEAGKIIFHYGGRPIRAQKSDIVRVISCLSTKDMSEYAIRNVVLEAVMSAESLSPGAGILMLRILLGRSDKKYVYDKRTEKDDIWKIVKNLIGEGLSQRIVKTIIDRSSIDSKITLSSSKMAYRPVVSVKNSLEMAGSLSEMFSTNRKRLENTGLMFVDGVIESLGEIECLLQDFYNEKRNLAIFARGFSPDVVSTLNQNYKLGYLYVFPIKMDLKEEVFERVKNHKNFYDIENYHLIRSLKTSDFDFDSSVDLNIGSVSIEGLESIKRNVHVTLPYHFSSVEGIVKDRLDYGRRVSIEAAASGHARVDSSHTESYSLKSVIQAKKSYDSLIKSISNLGCLVLQT